MSQYITTHTSDGKAIFSPKIPTEPHTIGAPGESTNQIIYSTESFPPNLSTEADIDAYATYRKEGPPPGTIGPAEGIAFGIITFEGKESPWHRTMTLDTIYILEGEAELHLDSGEMKHLKAGDSVVQRGTMHKWRNVTPNGGAFRMLGVAQPIQQPLEIGGQKLAGEWKA